MDIEAAAESTPTIETTPMETNSDSNSTSQPDITYVTEPKTPLEGGIAGLKRASEALEKAGQKQAKAEKITLKEGEKDPNQPPTPQYAPNYKFKVFDEELKKDIEKEFDDWAKGLIKSKEQEDKFRDLYTKVTGFESVKSSRNKLKNEVQKLQSESTDFKKSLSVLSDHVQNNDMQSFFEALKIPEDKVLRYAMERINYHQLPDDKKREYDGARDLKYRSQILAEDNQRLEQAHVQAQANVREQELGSALMSPDVKAIADAVDARTGPGSFRNEVIRRGEYYWHAHKKDIPVSQAIQEVVSLLGQPAQTMMPTTANAAMPGGAPEVVQAPEKKPIIPNIQGRGTSPAKKMPRSIADLKKLREGSM